MQYKICPEAEMESVVITLSAPNHVLVQFR